MPIQTVFVIVVPGQVTVQDRLTGGISATKLWFWHPLKVGLEGSQFHFTATDGDVYQRSQASLTPGALSQAAITDCASSVAGTARNSPPTSAVTTNALRLRTAGL
jgi:hypothetical protein